MRRASGLVLEAGQRESSARECGREERGKGISQDGSRKFLTLLASICADGSRLPPGLIYAGANGAIRETWVEDIEVGQHDVFVTAFPTGWSNNDIGLGWLEQVFDRFTKKKAGRSYRLLILDGHGSHITMDFIEYCDKRRNLLMVLLALPVPWPIMEIDQTNAYVNIVHDGAFDGRTVVYISSGRCGGRVVTA
jgi:hypothetical protein